MDDDFTPSTSDMPSEFADPEGDAEQLDPRDDSLPAGMFEMTSTRLRDLWSDWRCAKGPGRFANPEFFEKRIGGVPVGAVEAFAALEAALEATGYRPTSRWAYNCRKIRGTDRFSLHSYGIAIDIDPKLNKFTKGDPFDGKFTPTQIEAVLAIKNARGRSIWSWGGNWKKPDRMHFQLDQGPAGLEVDWSTVPGKDSGASPSRERVDPDPQTRPDGDEVKEDQGTRVSSGNREGENVLKKGSRGKAVQYFQGRLLVWNADALPEHGADGGYGDETTNWVRRFQTEMGIDATGNIDGVTAALLRGLTD
jgi:hypothetical protein